MRYVDKTPVGQTLPQGWAQRASDAATAVAAVNPQARSGEVNARRVIWGDLKDTLRQVSQNKCWYCESIEIRSDNAVDHFRPKNRVAESAGHSGYWWLAFSWDNYRFSCTFCNSKRTSNDGEGGGGKADRFPLRVEATRAHNPGDDLTLEDPVLLDPCIAADPGLLWFDETGQAVPGPVCGADDNAYPRQRVLTSIEVYHLNQPDLVDQRKVLCTEIRRRVKDADKYFARYSAGDLSARAAFEDAVRDLRDCLDSRAAYSSIAHAMLMGLRGTHAFVDVILSAV
jgi:hypothetical protein